MVQDISTLSVAVLEAFPYPVQVFSPDGTSVHINQAFLQVYNIPSADLLVNQFNILKDPDLSKSGLVDHVLRAFSGETTLARDILLPLDRLAPKYWAPEGQIEAITEDVMMYPVLDAQQHIVYVVSVMMNQRCHYKKPEIQQGLDYLNAHWMDKYNADAVAEAAGLSKTHFCRLFRKHLGHTPYAQYLSNKVTHIQTALADESLTVAQAFSACGEDYSGHIARVFRKHTGVTPTQYRKRVLKT